MKALLRKIRQILRDRKTRRIFTRLVSTVAAIVVFVTTYALVLPAITMESEAACGIEAHQHDQSCYTDVLVCELPESPGHVHDESCYITKEKQVCQIEEHVHDSDCYDGNGKLICEKDEHQHGEDCFEEVRELVCEIPESPGHQHDDSCYQKVLTCGREVHTHSTACYRADTASQAATEAIAVASTESAAAAATGNGLVDNLNAPAEYSESETSLDSSIENNVIEGNLDASPDYSEPGSDSTSLTNEGDKDEPGAWTSTEATADATAATAASTGSGAGVTGSTAAATAAPAGATDTMSVAAGYVPVLDELNFDTLLNKHTGIYYSRLAGTDSAVDNEIDGTDATADKGETQALDSEAAANNSGTQAQEVKESDAETNKDEAQAQDSNTAANTGEMESPESTDTVTNSNEAQEEAAAENTGELQEAVTWNRTDKHTELKESDNLRLYLAYTIPAGSLNETNQTARYSLPQNIRLTDEQIDEINTTVNGIAGQYVSYDTLEILDQEMYGKYLGIEAVEGTRTPADDLDEYLANNEGQEFISATVKVENVFDENTGLLKAQNLVFTFAPYTIQKNQHQYDSEGQPIKAGEEVNGWLAIDISTEQIDWEKADDETKTADIIFVEKDKKSDLIEISAELRLVEAEVDSDTDTNVRNAAKGVSSDVSATDNKQDGTKDSETAAGESDKAEKEPVSYPSVSFDDSITVAGGALPTDTDEASGDAGMAAETEITVHVEADKDTFPEGTTMVLSAVSDDQMAAVAEAVEGVVDAPKTMGFHAVDISFRDVKGNEIEPLKPIRVSMTSDAIRRAVEDESTAPVVVHVSDSAGDVPAEERNTDDGDSKNAAAADEYTDDGDSEPTVAPDENTDDGEAANVTDSDEAEGVADQHTAEPSETTTDQASDSSPDTPVASAVTIIETDTGTKEKHGDTLTFDAEAFSVYAIVYTVDFHYEINGKMYNFSIPGGGFVSLEHVVEVLGIASADENTGNEAENAENGAENADDFVGKVPGADESSESGTAYEEAIRLNKVEVSKATKKFVTDVESVEFSSPELVWIGKIEEVATVGEIKENKGLEIEYSAELTEEQIAEINAQTVEAGDWALISMQSFTSEESLTVTMKNGDSFVLKVTDAQKTAVSQLVNEQEYVLYIVRNNHYYALDKDGHTVQVPNDDLESLDSDYLWTYERKEEWREGSTWHNHSGTNYLDVYWTMEDGDNVPEDKGGSASKTYPVVTSNTSDNWEPIENLYETGGGFLFRDLNNDWTYLAYVDGHVRAINAFSYAAVHHTYAPQAVTIYIYKQGTPYTVDVQVNDNEMGSVQYVHNTTSLETSIDTPVITVPTEKVESGNKKVLDNLVAVPKEGYAFTGWTIVKEEWDTASIVTDWGTSQTGATIRPTVSADKMTLQANFAPAIQYNFTVETNNAEYGLVGGTNAIGKEVGEQESYEGQSTTVIGGAGKNPYAITATRKPGCRFVGWRLTNENGDFINSYGTNGDGNNDWTFTLDARMVSLPSDKCTLTAVFEDKSDNEVNKIDIDKLLDDWAKDLKGDLTDADKTAHVVDPANRIYQINLSASSKKWIAYPSITLDFITDTSRSMYFPANMVKYGNFKSVGLESWLNSRTDEEKQKVYYVVSDLYDRSDGSKENAATVYAVWWNGSNWKYKDSSYKYHADYNTGGTEWTVNSTNVDYITIKKGNGTSETNYQKLTGVIYTSSDPPTSYTSNNVNATINDEYWSRLDYLYKAVMTATETLKAIDPNSTITLTTFNKASEHVGLLESTEEAIYNQLTSEISLSGGTRQDEGLYSSRTGESCDDNAGAGSNNGVRAGLQGRTKDKFVIAITDGAPNFGNKYTGNPWEDAIKPQANKLKAIEDADGYLTLMTLCLGSNYVGTNEGEFASLSSDPSKYAKNANDGQAIVDAIEELVQHMLKKANLFGTATDTLDPAFYPVTADGDPVQENLYYDNNGVLIGNGRTKPSGYTPYCQWTRDGEQWNITYYNQTFKWADEGGWNRSFYVKAKENFLGGNAIETNDAASLKVTDAIIRDDQSQTHHTLKDKNGNAKPVTKTLPTPHVNVRQLLMNENSTRWTLYVETEVSPEPQIQKLFQNILVEELVEKSSAERVTVANNMIKDGDYMLPTATEETKPETFYLHTVIRDLTPTDWSNLKNPSDPEKPYIEIPYNGDKAYGHNAGVIRLTLTKTGKKAEYETHKTSDSTSDKEEYVLTAQYVPNSATVMLEAHNIDQATDQQKAKDDALWHTTFGESSGDEIRNGRPSSNKHIIDLFVRGLALTKTDETYKNGLAGAVFELYRPAIGDETASGDLPDGVPSGYVLSDTLAVNDSGIVYKNGIKLLSSPKTTYYLVEKTPPEGYVKLIDAIPVELKVTNHYESPVANGATPVTTDGGEAPDVLYNWYQKASLTISEDSGVMRTTGSYDPEDPATDLTHTSVEPTSLYEVMYYRIANNPGVELPATGGPGTRLFTILGSILIFGAGVLLWRRRGLI